MIDRDHPDASGRGRLTDQDLAIAANVGRYAERPRARRDTRRARSPRETSQAARKHAANAASLSGRARLNQDPSPDKVRG